MPDEIAYTRIPKRDLEIIRPLWEKLRAHHMAHSVNFREFYDAFTFEVRMKKFFELPESNLFVEVAEGPAGDIAGYCISSVTADGAGELESIYVEEEFRKRGVGAGLVRNSIEWLKSRNCAKISVAVANGNEAAFPFYEQFGFRHRLSVLELKD